jgi:hypothetical protein
MLGVYYVPQHGMSVRTRVIVLPNSYQQLSGKIQNLLGAQIFRLSNGESVYVNDSVTQSVVVIYTPYYGIFF